MDTDHVTSMDDFGHLGLHGDAQNRWFDKSIQLIVTPDGQAGLNGEVIFLTFRSIEIRFRLRFHFDFIMLLCQFIGSNFSLFCMCCLL